MKSSYLALAVIVLVAYIIGARMPGLAVKLGAA